MAPWAQQGGNPWFVGRLLVAQRAPFGSPFSTICVGFRCFLESFFRSSVLKACGLHFSWIVSGFRDDLFRFFLCVSGASITKENVVSIHYLLCFKHITLLDKGEKSIENQHLFEDTSGKGLGIGFWSNLGSILDAFWHPLWSKMQKNGGPKNSQKTGAPKSPKKITREKHGHALKKHYRTRGTGD